jgi:hypothetical protein
MSMLMSLCLMSRMIVMVRPVLSCVIMVMNLGSLAVVMLMKMLVKMFVGMGVGMLVVMFRPVMGVFVRVAMGMIMPVQMLVFVLSFHFCLLRNK